MGGTTIDAELMIGRAGRRARRRRVGLSWGGNGPPPASDLLRSLLY
jgi:hypothetical protein